MRFFTFFALLFAVTSFAQYDVKGYYVTTSGQKTDGYFKPADFFDTPSLRFSTSEYGNYIALPQEVVEYGIYDDDLKFQKHTVDIDISGNEGFQKNPEWSKQTVFLNVIVEGTANLYSYTKDFNTKFFFSTQSVPGSVNQLIYKKYRLLDGSNTEVENAAYKQQLYNSIKCESHKISDFSYVKYEKNSLIDIFKEYYECTGSKSRIYGTRVKSGFTYSIFAGVHTLKLNIVSAFPDVDANSALTYNFGGEVAYTFPKEKFSLFFSAEFETLNCEIVDDYDQGYNVLESTYKLDAFALNFVVGPRYNFVTLKNHKLFLDAGFVFSVPFGDIKHSTLITPPVGEPYSGDHAEHTLETGFGVNLGLGYTFKKKYGIAVRYVTNRDFLDDVYSSFKTSISRVGVVLSYTIN